MRGIEGLAGRWARPGGGVAGCVRRAGDSALLTARCKAFHPGSIGRCGTGLGTAFSPLPRGFLIAAIPSPAHRPSLRETIGDQCAKQPPDPSPPLRIRNGERGTGNGNDRTEALAAPRPGLVVRKAFHPGSPPAPTCTPPNAPQSQRGTGNRERGTGNPFRPRRGPWPAGR